MKDSELWLKLKSADMVNGEMPVAEEQSNEHLWYVRVLQGFAGWLAAVFLIGFLGFGIAGFFEYGVAMMVLGLIINISTYVFYKKNVENDFFEQMVLAFSLTGQFLFAIGLFTLFDFKGREWLVIIGVYQVILIFTMNQYLHRFLSTWFAVIALFWGFDILVYSGLGSALVGVLFVWVWLTKIGWDADQDFYQPIGYALALSILQLNAQSHFWLFDFFRHHNNHGSWIMNNSDWISALLNSAVLIYFVYQVAQEQKVKFNSKSGKLVVLACVILLFSALPVIGLSSALLVLLLGYSRQNKILMVMGILALIGFVGWYYYSLNITLLLKSMILVSAGVVLLVGYLLVKYTFSGKGNEKNEVVENNESIKWQKFGVITALLISMTGVNHAIWQKENLLDNGQSVFLELAPVDPRSIMQGDYMRLRFDVANKIRDAHKEQQSQYQSIDGYVVVDVDDRGVGTFATIYQEQEMLSGQLKIKYRMRNRRVQIATNAFFFQEGDAKIFDDAKYGEFKVADDGEVLLKAMYDPNLVLLGHNKLD